MTKLQALACHHVKCGEVLCRGCDAAVPVCGGTDGTHLPTWPTDTTVIGSRPGQYRTVPGTPRATATVVFCCANRFVTYPVPGIGQKEAIFALRRPPVAAAAIRCGETTDLSDADGPTDARTAATVLQTGTGH